MGDAAPSNLTHSKGEVWLVDFWATWCPPCQAPMQHNQDMLEKRAADWAGKVRIIGLSIDNTMDAVQKHVEAKKWQSVEHYHRAGSSCSKDYSVRGVPHVMLIDQNGKIAFKGHPASRPNLEADLDTLAKGEALTGEGTESKSSEETATDDTNAKVFELDQVNKEIEAGKEAMLAMQADASLKEAAKDMPRSFCVLVLEQEYNPSTGNSNTKFTNYRVLVGKQESIDLLKSAMDEKVKGCFELKLQERAL